MKLIHIKTERFDYFYDSKNRKQGEFKMYFLRPNRRFKFGEFYKNNLRDGEGYVIYMKQKERKEVQKEIDHACDMIKVCFITGKYEEIFEYTKSINEALGKNSYLYMDKVDNI